MGRKKKRIKLNCEQCGKVITGRGKRFCSVSCHGLWNSENRRGENGANWKGGNIKLICEQCKKEFEVILARANKARFCSQGCKAQWQTENTHGENHSRWEERVGLVCEHCEKEFEVIPSHAFRRRFCSYECRDLQHSENFSGENNPCWKEKVKLICEQCEEAFEVFPYLVDQRKFCSTKCAGQRQSENQCGENNPSWRGGISFEPYGIEWTDKLKEVVRERDEYTCAISGEVWQLGQEKFPVHHINYCKTDNLIENLITLCIKCHGKTNANRKHWQALLTPIAETRVFVEVA